MEASCYTKELDGEASQIGVCKGTRVPPPSTLNLLLSDTMKLSYACPTSSHRMRLLHRGDACCYKGTIDIVELCLVADLLVFVPPYEHLGLVPILATLKRRRLLSRHMPSPKQILSERALRTE